MKIAISKQLVEVRGIMQMGVAILMNIVSIIAIIVVKSLKSMKYHWRMLMKKYLSKLVIFILLLMTVVVGVTTMFLFPEQIAIVCLIVWAIAVPCLIWQIACVIYEEMKQ